MDGILCGSVSSGSKLVRVQAGRDVVSENQFLKALHQDGGESHRAVDILTRHSRLFRYMDNVGCLEAGGDSLLWE